MPAPVLIAVALLAAPTTRAGANDPAADHLALTISGGVSLGAYEAGLNWAFVRFMRQRDREFAADESRALLRSRRPPCAGLPGSPC